VRGAIAGIVIFSGLHRLIFREEEIPGALNIPTHSQESDRIVFVPHEKHRGECFPAFPARMPFLRFVQNSWDGEKRLIQISAAGFPTCPEFHSLNVLTIRDM
jgi:hypothetical protein